MPTKDDLIKNSIFMISSLAAIYFINGKKYINLSSFFTLGISYGMARSITLALQKNNAGGTTPYNPLKIPAKKITPANH